MDTQTVKPNKFKLEGQVEPKKIRLMFTAFPPAFNRWQEMDDEEQDETILDWEGMLTDILLLHSTGRLNDLKTIRYFHLTLTIHRPNNSHVFYAIEPILLALRRRKIIHSYTPGVALRSIKTKFANSLDNHSIATEVIIHKEP